MSHFTRMKKTGESIHKDGMFYSGDTGGADGGASGQPQVQPSTTAHLQMVSDRHEAEGDLHNGIASRLQQVGMDKRAADHRALANEHQAAAAHYQAAADAAQNDSGKDEVAKHLKAARACAQAAQGKCDGMCA